MPSNLYYSATNSNSRFNLYQKSEAELIKKVKLKFGPPATTTILLGDWNGAHMRFHAPCKVKGFRNTFKRAGYDVFLVNEHLTSQTCPCCNEKSLEKFRIRPSPRPWRRRAPEPVHGLLRCKSEYCQPFVNRNNVFANQEIPEVVVENPELAIIPDMALENPIPDMEIDNPEIANDEMDIDRPELLVAEMEIDNPVIANNDMEIDHPDELAHVEVEIPQERLYRYLKSRYDCLNFIL